MGSVRDAGSELIYLTACALHGERPDAQCVAGMDMQALYALAKAQSLGCMTASALLSSGALAEAEQIRWKELRDRAVRRNMLLDAERAQLLAFLEEEGIWYLPLKGAVIQALYPSYGMRQMGDNDLLVDKKGLEKIEGFMLQRGYRKQAGSDKHDAYLKEPVYNFEIHWTLAESLWIKQKYDIYYEKVENLLRPGDTPFARKLSNEDNYVYLTAHACKHMQGGGAGLRTAVDLYVCRRAWRDMDLAYVDKVLEELGLASFERTLRGLAQKLFDRDGAQPEPAEEELLRYMLGSGTYGRFSNTVSNRMEKIARKDGSQRGVRGKYLFRRLFPTAEQMKVRFPVLRRAAWLLPVMYVLRMARGAATRLGSIVREVGLVLKKR